MPKGRAPMSDRPPHPEDELTPLSADELERDIKIHMAAMRARKESGALREESPYFAKRLVERLWYSGFMPFRRRNDYMHPNMYPVKPEQD
jgi:hypothetical protein